MDIIIIISILLTHNSQRLDAVPDVYQPFLKLNAFLLIVDDELLEAFKISIRVCNVRV